MKLKSKPKKLDQSKLSFLPVPDGMRMFYTHYYKQADFEGAPKKLIGTRAVLRRKKTSFSLNGESTISWEEAATAEVHVHPNDTPFKKLGRCIAHNRTIKTYLRSLANASES